MRNPLKFKLDARSAPSEANPDNGSRAHRQSERSQPFEFPEEPGPIDLRGSPSPASLLARSGEPRAFSARWSDQENGSDQRLAWRPGSARSASRFWLNAGSLVGGIAAVSLGVGLAALIFPDGRGDSGGLPSLSASDASAPQLALAEDAFPAPREATIPPVRQIPARQAAAAPAVSPIIAVAPTTETAVAENPPVKSPVSGEAADKPAIVESAYLPASSPPTVSVAVADQTGENDDDTDDTATASVAPIELTGAVEQNFPEISDEASDAVLPATEKTSQSGVGRPAKIRSAVNMRSAGRKGSRVLGVIPTGATVDLIDCDQWCKVTYNGKQGYIFKSYVQGERGVVKREKTRSTVRISTRSGSRAMTNRVAAADKSAGARPAKPAPAYPLRERDSP